jgi:diacylglycerol O-acyltransferase / trehalose O-mycolyltransferase
LRRILERDYGAGTRRVIAGQSMGGLGAMSYSARHPGLFLGAASFSGLLHPLDDTDFLLGLFSRYTPEPLAIWGDPARQRDVWSSHDPTTLAERLQRTQIFVSAGDGRPGPFDLADAEPDRIEQTVLRESRAFVGRLPELPLPVGPVVRARSIEIHPAREATAVGRPQLIPRVGRGCPADQE